ncbi:MAG: hypothetical protein ABI846_14480 [Rudaea sp.]
MCRPCARPRALPASGFWRWTSAAYTGARHAVRACSAIDADYLPFSDDLAVAGRRLPAAKAGAKIDLRIAIPARYSIVARGTPVVGMLDGAPFVAAQPIAAGAHAFVPTADTPEFVVIWTKALERGFAPLPADERIAPANW